MNYSSIYTGPQIDAALKKISEVNVVESGWVLLPSDPTNLVNINTVTNPGNYSAQYYMNGPVGVSVQPINIIVIKKAEYLHQVVNGANQYYERMINISTGELGAWARMEVGGIIFVGDTAPTLPVNGKTIWLNSSDTVPSLTLYLNGNWVPFSVSGAMMESVYDPTGLATDLYEYIDQQVESSSTGDAGIDYVTHIENADIHVSEDERLLLNNAADQTYVDTKTTELYESLTDDVVAEVNKNIDVINSVSTEVNALGSALSTHVNNSTIHPNATKQTEWDNKAAGDHTHILDGRVEVNFENVEGELTSVNMPYNVKERVYQVSTMEELLALTLNPYHNGDTINLYNDTDTENIINRWFFIYDDLQLGTMQAFIELKLEANVSWSDIEELPTTILGYGITDAVDKNEFDMVSINIDRIIANTPTATDITKIGESVTLLDELNTRLLALDRVYTNMDLIIARVSELCKL